MSLDGLCVYCCDIGSVRNFGWARICPSDGNLVAIGGSGIDGCADHLRTDLEAGRVVTLGIEAPAYLPVPPAAGDLCKGRPDEGDRSCFAPAGIYVAGVGLHELAYILRRCGRHRATVCWKSWSPADPSAVLLWEAFVSKSAHTKTGDHVADAVTAAAEFLDRAARGPLVSDIEGASSEVISLVGAAALWAGWSDDVSLLRERVLVVRPATARGPEVVRE